MFKINFNKKKKKAQVSIEMIMILAVVIIIAIVVATLFINGLNKNTDTTAKSNNKLDDSVTNFVNDMNTNTVVDTSCPVGYVFVPGSIYYNTLYDGVDGFCVMKYEAKVDKTGDGIGDDACNTGYNTWSNTSSTCAYNYGNNKLVSSAQGFPLTNISESEAKTACSSLGSKYHLITNNERMTITRNLEQVNYNWSSLQVGNGFLYSGHNDYGPAHALDASTNDNQGYYLTGDSTSTCDGSYTNFLASDDTNTGRACLGQRRTLKLSNGNVIWDFSGNVREWEDKTINAQDEPSGSGFLSKSGAWIEFKDIVDKGTLSDSEYRSSNYSWDSNQSIGKLYTDAGDTGLRGFLYGGDWANGSRAGIFTLILDNAPTVRDYSYGFRCVYVP